MERIEAAGIASAYGSRKVLRDVNISAGAGECVGLAGANGCGKSTLLNILAGMRRADAGRISFDGRTVYDADVSGIHWEKRFFPRYTGYVPQECRLLEELTVKDNLLLWYGDKKALKEALEGRLLTRLGLEELLRRPVKKLSGGQKKRVSIGCALAGEPPVLLLDEPGAALDIPGKLEVRAYLREYKKMGGTVIMATHEENDLELCDKAYALKDGVSVEVPVSLRGEALMEML